MSVCWTAGSIVHIHYSGGSRKEGSFLKEQTCMNLTVLLGHSHFHSHFCVKIAS